MQIKIINKTAALQTILLSGDQPLPIPTTDAGVTITLDLDREDDRMQGERLYKALTLPSIKRQRTVLNELAVEGFEALEAQFGPKKAPAAGDDKPKTEGGKQQKPPAQPPQPPAAGDDKPKT